MSESPTPVSELGYEQCRDELVQVVQLLEQGGLDLDASLREYTPFSTEESRCEEHLAGARARIEEALAGHEED